MQHNLAKRTYSEGRLSATNPCIFLDLRYRNSWNIDRNPYAVAVLIIVLLIQN